MWCVCVCGVCGKTDYTATLKVFRVRVLSVAKIRSKWVSTWKVCDTMTTLLPNDWIFIGLEDIMIEAQCLSIYFNVCQQKYQQTIVCQGGHIPALFT